MVWFRYSMIAFILIALVGSSACNVLPADPVGPTDGAEGSDLQGLVGVTGEPTYLPAGLVSMGPVTSVDYASNVGYTWVGWSPNGQYLAYCGRLRNGTDHLRVLTFNGTALELVASISPGINSFTLAWSPDGKYIALGGSYGGGDNLRVYSFNGTSLVLMDSRQLSSWVHSVAWAPDGKRLAVCGFQGLDDVFVYSFDGDDLTLVDSVRVFSYNVGWGQQIVWNPDGKWLAAVGTYDVYSMERKGRLAVLSLDEWDLSLRETMDFGYGASAIGWSPSGDHLVVGGNNNTADIVLYEINITLDSIILTELDNMDFGYEPRSISWSPNGAHFVVAGDSRSTWDVGLCSFNGSSFVTEYTYKFVDRANAAYWSSDAMHIVASGSNGVNDITVYGIGYERVSYPDEATGAEDTELTIDVLANDRTISGTLAVTNVTTPAIGSAEISDDGTYITYTPRQEWSGNDTFTYRHSDMAYSSAPTIVNVSVFPVNDVPEVTTMDLEVAVEDVVYDTVIQAFDGDGDLSLTWSLRSDASWLSIDSSTGRMGGLPGNDDVGAYWVNVSVTDTNATSGWRNLTIEVENVNDDPGIITVDVAETDEDALYSVVYKAVDVDPTGDLFVWSLDSDTPWLSMEGNHLYGIPGNDHVGEWRVNVTVNDGMGGSGWSEFILNVVNINDAPWITSIPITQATEDIEHTQVFKAEDVDVGDTLTWSFMGPTWLTMDEDTGTLTGTPSNAEVGPHWMSITVSDGLEEDSVYFMLTVENINDPPTWVLMATDQELMEGDVLILDVRARDVDRDQIFYGLVSNPSSGISISTDIGTIRWLEAIPGTYDVEVTATDGTETISHAFTIEVEAEPEPPEPPANKIPVIADVGVLNITAGEAFHLSLMGSDGDEWDEDNLTFSLVNGPVGMVISHDGEVLWLPDDNTVGVRYVTVELSDGKDEAELSFEVEVLEAVVDDGDTSGVEDGGDYLWLVAALVVVVLLLVVLLLWMYMGPRQTPVPDITDDDDGSEDTG